MSSDRLSDLQRQVNHWRGLAIALAILLVFTVAGFTAYTMRLSQRLAIETERADDRAAAFIAEREWANHNVELAGKLVEEIHELREEVEALRKGR